MRQVSFDHYGGVEVLELVEAEKPEVGDGELLVAVRATGINPFDFKVRRGLFDGVFPIELPTTQGTDVAGVIEAVGSGVEGFVVGDEVLGSTGKRRAQADFALVPASTALKRPAAISWEVAGSLWTVGTTASAMVRSVAIGSGDVVLVAGASGGVGGLVCQLARHRGAQVLGVAGEDGHDWLRAHGVEPIIYGEGLQSRIEAISGRLGRPVSAVLDTVGSGYVELGIALGVAPARIDTIVDNAAAERVGAKTDGAAAATTADMRELLVLMAAGAVELPIHRSYPLAQVRDAYTELEQGHPRGKIVLIP